MSDKVIRFRLKRPFPLLPNALAEPYCSIRPELLARTERVLALHTGAASISRVRPAEPLSVREQEILRWLSSQLSLREIAGQLFLSYDTVKSHARHIYRKLGVSSREQAVSQVRDGYAN